MKVFEEKVSLLETRAVLENISFALQMSCKVFQLANQNSYFLEQLRWLLLCLEYALKLMVVFFTL